MRLLRLLEVRGAVMVSCPKSPLVLGPWRRSRRTRSGSSPLQCHMPRSTRLAGLVTDGINALVLAGLQTVWRAA